MKFNRITRVTAAVVALLSAALPAGAETVLKGMVVGAALRSSHFDIF